MQIKLCSKSDVSRLAEMNKHLIEDEKSDNPMNLSDLENRMSGFITNEYNAYFFVENDVVVGYALVRESETETYLRQFYIERDLRRNHLGTDAFNALSKYLGKDNITLEVLPWNDRGLSFWKSLGFKEAAITMKLK